MTQPQGALLVGSVNLPDAETTLRTAAAELGARLRRIPDGEPGERHYWIAFQPDRIAQTPGIERVGEEPIQVGPFDMRPVRIADDVDADSLELGNLGYADGALESYAVFRRLRDEGVIAPGTRFQVSLPTAFAVSFANVPEPDRARFEPVYRRALERELGRILDGIPHEDLAIQWDTAVEFMVIEGRAYGNQFASGGGVWFDDPWAGLLERAVHQASLVPEDVELGIHLCYGDAGEQHFVEPADTANLVKYANAVSAAIDRPIQWIHLPVPIERDDDGYFAALEGLELDPGTEVYLGLVHREDGAEGARRRIAAAQRHLARFGVATECGMGRAPGDATPGLLATHAEVSTGW